VLFNLHRALATGGRSAIVVEGFLDTLVVHQAGYPAVVGLMGSTLSRYHADLLATHFDRVVLMLDGDEAGRQGAMSVAHTLGVCMSVAAVSVEDGRQPDQLGPAVIHQLVCDGGAEFNSEVCDRPSIFGLTP
jgi:DNA primase